MILKRIILACSILFGVLTLGFLNYCIVEPLIVRDPCDYHGKETNGFFNLFYKMESSDGFHPAPTHFNLIVTLTLGLITGYLLYQFISSQIANG